ncbi:MAG: enterochelin esterase domain-containing protein [Gibbsiella quercinecans]|uniref:enterochelin esterase domain-containing protein n=1 Tax=Gibbsiella quercinecans TaxID=929813 RepID=UPI003F2AACCC
MWLLINCLAHHHQPNTPQSLRRLPGTGVWSRQTELPGAWRGSYCFIPCLDNVPPAVARGDRHADIPYRSWPARHDVDSYGVANGRRSGFAKTIFGWRCRKNCYRRLQHGRRTTWRPPAPWWRPVFDVCRPALARAI